jgi:hypothetical protein
MLGDVPVPSDTPYQRALGMARREFTEEVTRKIASNPFPLGMVITVHYMLIDCVDGLHWIAWRTGMADMDPVIIAVRTNPPQAKWKTLGDARSAIHKAVRKRKV